MHIFKLEDLFRFDNAFADYNVIIKVSDIFEPNHKTYSPFKLTRVRSKSLGRLLSLFLSSFLWHIISQWKRDEESFGALWNIVYLFKNTFCDVGENTIYGTLGVVLDDLHI